MQDLKNTTKDRRLLDLEEKRLIVSQDNRLIQNIATDENKKRNIKMSSFILSPYQKKFISLMMSHLKPCDTEFPLEEITVNDFIYLMDIPKGGNTYQKVHQAIQDLMSISFAIEEEPKRWKYLRWIATGCIVDENNNTITLKFDDCLKPYLLGLDRSFTAYELGYISNLKKKYSLRLYEFLRSYLSLGKVKISVNDFIAKIVDNQYQNITDIERYVIKPALDEINKTTDINAEYFRVKAKKDKRSKTTHFFFSIEMKGEDDLREVISTWGGIPMDEISEIDFSERPKFKKERENCTTPQAVPKKADDDEVYPFDV